MFCLSEGLNLAPCSAEQKSLSRLRSDRPAFPIPAGRGSPDAGKQDTHRRAGAMHAAAKEAEILNAAKGQRAGAAGRLNTPRCFPFAAACAPWAEQETRGGGSAPAARRDPRLRHTQAAAAR